MDSTSYGIVNMAVSRLVEAHDKGFSSSEVKTEIIVGICFIWHKTLDESLLELIQWGE